MDPLTISAFLGANLAFDDLQLPTGVGVSSLNQRPGFGDLRPWNAPGAAVAAVPTSPQRKTIYRMGQDVASEANYWLGWSTVVHAVRGFDTEDTSERTYFTGSGTPKWTDNIIGLGGGPPYPQAARELAVPAPTTALVGSINTNPATGSDQAFSWVYTFVNDLEWESAPSPVSNTLLAKQGCTFNLTGFDTAPAGNYGITKIRLYRLQPSTSTTAAAHFFEREWLIGSTPANPIDDARALDTDPIATTSWRPPPADGHGLVKMWNGMLGMGSGKSFRICEPYKPYAWPIKYEVGLSAAFVAAGVWGQRAIILTTGDAQVIAGSDPAGIDEEPAKINRPCSSATSVVEFNEGEAYKGVAWASEDCLCWFGDGGYRNLTEGFFTPEQWRALAPATMVATRHLGFYVCFYNDGALKGFVIDPKNPQGIYFLSVGYDAAFRDPISDKLFVLEGGNVRRWNAGAALTATFRSKAFQTPNKMRMSAVEVVAKGFPVRVKMWADGVLRLDRDVNDGDPVRPTGGWLADTFQFEVSSASRVLAVRAAETIADLKRV